MSSLVSVTLVAVLASAPVISAQSQKLHSTGLSQANAGSREEAKKSFLAATRADPKNYLAFFDLGGLAEDAGDKDSALDYYLKTAAIRPDFVEAHAEAGTIYLLHKHDFARAEAAFRAVLLEPNPLVIDRFPLDRSRSQSAANLAVVYAQMGRLGVAQAMAESALRDESLARNLDPRLAEIARRTKEDMEKASGRVFQQELSEISQELHKGSPEKALSRYLAFAKQHGGEQLKAQDAWDLWEGTAYAQAMTGHTADCLASFDKAIRAASSLRPRLLQESKFNKACALVELGRQAEALDALEGVLWIDALTLHQPGVDSGHYFRAVKTDRSLAPLQGPRLEKVLRKFAAQTQAMR